MYVNLFTPSIIAHKVCSFSETLNNEFVALCPTVDILDIIRCGLKVTGCIVALGDEDVVVHTALKWLVQRDWGTLTLSADLDG